MTTKEEIKRMMIRAKKQERIRQQFEAELVARNQDPRFQAETLEEHWAESEDAEHEARVMRTKQRILQQQYLRKMRQQLNKQTKRK